MPPALPSGKSLDNPIAARATDQSLYHQHQTQRLRVCELCHTSPSAFKRKIYLRRDPEPPAERVRLDYRRMFCQYGLEIHCTYFLGSDDLYLVPWVWAVSRARVPQPTEHKTGCTFLGPSAGLRYEGPTVVDEDLGIGSVYIWDIRRYRYDSLPTVG
ncbi:hypothetical protein C8R48DRAFT_673554 [Suillus tomentosus]|nr:hypothetical protein C8R48DRAFT_673554 [Suillus tomentosus]